MLGYSCLLAWHGTHATMCVFSVSRHLLNAVVVIEDMYVNVVSLVSPPPDLQSRSCSSPEFFPVDAVGTPQ
jgi:hypothetical protein